jgi:hypothetical protein
MKSLTIINGDIAVDSRGKVILCEGKVKVSNQINYALSNSAFIQALFFPNGQQKPSSNEVAIRSAINKTMQALIHQHQQNTSLPATERIVSTKNLKVIEISKTEFKFTIQVNTKDGQNFDLAFDRSLNG